MVEGDFKVLNKLGLHARPAAAFVRCAQRFQSDIHIIARGQAYSAKRIVDILSAALSVEMPFRIVAEGPDAELAVSKLRILLHQFVEMEQSQESPSNCSGLKWFKCDGF
jgi:phosphocarrier protein HPr